MSDSSILKHPIPYWKWFLFNLLFFLMLEAGDLATDLLTGREILKWWIILLVIVGDVLLALLFAYFDMLLFNPPKDYGHKKDDDKHA